MRIVIQYGSFVLLGMAMIWLLSFVVEKGIKQVDDMLVPCQHGTSYIQGRCRCDGTPFNGTYCSNCKCEYGSCSTDPTTPFSNSDYGCRCPTQSKRFGFLCDLCNTIDEECKGDCKPEFFGPRCERICYADLAYDNNNSVCNTMRSSGGTCSTCHGHGTCNDGFCDCDDNWFDDGRRECVKTCPGSPICSGHGTCKLYGDTPGCLCEKGWNGPDCNIPCPGVLTTGIPCNLKGVCNVDFDTNTATCECNEKFRGPDCSIECPGDVVSCNGHGTCDDLGVCTCQTNVKWSLPSCKCSDELTCNAKGTCNAQEQCECFGNNMGQHCLECKENWHGDNCDLYCDPYLKANVSDKIEGQFGCYGHGTCLPRDGAMQCTCNLDTTVRRNIQGAVNDYTSFYDPELNCGECLDNYFPKQWVVDQYGMPGEYTVPCEGECLPSTCNNRGVCNHNYGVPGELLCKCDIEHLDDSSFCTVCESNWYPLDFGKPNFCNRYCVASGALPTECDGSIDCVSCNGHGTCTQEGDCLCTGGYTGDQCQIYCAGENGQVCNGHGVCESNEIQQLMEHEFRAEGNIPLFSCTCDPQDPVDADSRIDWDEKLALGLVNGTLDDPPRPEYFGETCGYQCVKPPWEDSDECNGMGNCSIVTIRTPNDNFVSCFSDDDCTNSATIQQIISGDETWNSNKGPFCHKQDDISGCDKSTDDCYEILLKQRPRKMRSEDCAAAVGFVEVSSGVNDMSVSQAECEAYASSVSAIWNGVQTWAGAARGCIRYPDGTTYVYNLGQAYTQPCNTNGYKCIHKANTCLPALDAYDWHQYCTDVKVKRQPSKFSGCNSVASFCPAKSIPTHCKPMLDLTDGTDVSYKLNLTYEYDKRQYPFLISDNYRSNESTIEHDEAFAEFQSFVYNKTYKLKSDFCTKHSSRYPTISKVRENKQYLCNGAIVNNTNCNGVLTESQNNFYYPFMVDCINSVERYKTYEEAVLNRGSGCIIVETQKDIVYANDTDGKQYIDAMCNDIISKFPSCKRPEPCDFSPCSDSSYTCENSGTKAICTTSADLNSTCLKGISERLTFNSYSCDIEVTDATCPKNVTFNTNVAKHCKDNNPILSRVRTIGNNNTENITIGKYVHFLFKASDIVSTNTRLEFGEAIVVYIRQGQIQLNEVESLQSCPITNQQCNDEWSYTPEKWYHLELELNGTHVTMTRKDTGSIITKLLLDNAPITTIHTIPGSSIATFKEIVTENDIPSPYTCTYETCNLDVSYREICSDIIRNVEYPSLLEPTLVPVNVCSILHENTRLHMDETYEITDSVYNLDWDKYCVFYQSLKDPQINSTHEFLETYTECREFIDPLDGDKTCISDALDFNWTLSCSQLYDVILPSTLKQACPNTCYNHLLNVEHDYCEEREEIFSANKAVIDLPGCSTDWYDYCLKDNKGTLQGKCSAVECTCDYEQFEGISGESCQLHCPLAFDGTACAEGSGMGICSYTKNTKYTLDTFGKVDPIWAIEGECKCFLSEGTRNCDIQCRDCNTNMSSIGQIGICDNSRGVCDCLPPFTTIEHIETTDWRGRNISLIERSYTDGNLTGTDHFRMRAMQGKKSFVKNALQKSPGVSAYDGTKDWEEIWNDFTDNPSNYWCLDKQCDYGNSVLASNLDETSYRYNYDCNSICPSTNMTTGIPCSGHGVCGVKGQCVCDVAKIQVGQNENGFREVFQVIPGIEIESTSLTISALDRTGYRGDGCEKTCRGYDEANGDMSTICNGHGKCDLAGECACDLGYIGVDCEFKCPMSEGADNLCSGHGTCELTEITFAQDKITGQSTSCENYANFDICNGYATLLELDNIIVAGIDVNVGETACAPIGLKSCMQWPYYQDTYYYFSGTIDDNTKPAGCIIQSQRVEYNIAVSDKGCTASINCACRDNLPDKVYCTKFDEFVVTHEIGGTDYKIKPGRWSGTVLNTSATLELAKQSCSSDSSCVGVMEDPPGSQSYKTFKKDRGLVNIGVENTIQYESKGTTFCKSSVWINYYNAATIGGTVEQCQHACTNNPSCLAISYRIFDERCVQCISFDLFKHNSGYRSFLKVPLNDASVTNVYKKHVKYLDSLCVSEAGIKTDPKTNFPIQGGLYKSNDKCREEKTEGKCNVTATLEQCRRYGANFQIVNSPFDPHGCFSENGNYSFNTEGFGVVLVDSGSPDFSVEEKYCEEYANINNYVYYSDPFALSEFDATTCYRDARDGECKTNEPYMWGNCRRRCATTASPRGCVQRGNAVWYNPGENFENDCGTSNTRMSSVKCVQTGNATSAPCDETHVCQCPTNLYMDKLSKKCVSIDKSPIIGIDFFQDRGTPVETKMEIECRIDDNVAVCAQCSCFTDYVNGLWAGFECETCALGHGKSQCREKCPDFDGENTDSMCGGNGVCLFGSKMSGVERVFQTSKCMCGQDRQIQERQPVQSSSVVATYPATKEEALTDYFFYTPRVSSGYFGKETAMAACDALNDISLADYGGFCYGIINDYKRNGAPFTGTTQTPLEVDESVWYLHIGYIGTQFFQYGRYYRKTLISGTTPMYSTEEYELFTGLLPVSIQRTCMDDISVILQGKDTCNHFSTESDSCDMCEESWSGKNCRNKCQKCLMGGSCDNKPSEEEYSKCICPSGSGTWDKQCCPVGFAVGDLITWFSKPQEDIDQIRLLTQYDELTENELDASFYCKKCPGVTDNDWLNPSAAFKACSGPNRGECINEGGVTLTCSCTFNKDSGTIWKGRACACDDTITTPYSSDPSIAESTDYGCAIPSGNTAKCPESSQMDAIWFLPTTPSSMTYSPTGYSGWYAGNPWKGLIAGEIVVKESSCNYFSIPLRLCHNGEGNCASDSECAEGLLCFIRTNGEKKVGYDTSKVSVSLNFCYDPSPQLIGCAPNFYKYDGFYQGQVLDQEYYWTGTQYANSDTLGYYIPMIADGANALIINKRKHKCPPGTFGVRDDYHRSSPKPYVCVKCPRGTYNDLFGQTGSKMNSVGAWNTGNINHGCKACPTGKFSLSSGLTTDANCQDCGDGKTSVNGVCVNCACGKFEEDGVCKDCASGHYSGQGWTECKQCAAGKYVKNICTGNYVTNCENCAAGKYSNDDRVCTNCAKGKHQNNAGRTSCYDCGVGEYQNSEGQSYCKTCGRHYPYGYYRYVGDPDDRSTCKYCAQHSYYPDLDGPYGPLGIYDLDACYPCPSGKYGVGSRWKTCTSRL